MAEIWAPKMMIEKRYARSIKKLFEEFENIIKAFTNPDDILSALVDYTATKAFKKAAGDIAMKMVTHLFNDGQRTWREAARVNSQGREIYELLKNELNTTPMGALYYELIQSNALLITTLPDEISYQVIGEVMEMQQQGKRANEIAEEIKKLFPETTKARAKLIARTEVSKASTALTQARCDYMDIKWYVWKTSSDARVRKSHDHMDNVLINWNDPPSPEKLAGLPEYGKYHAGNTFNCRCYPEPLIELKYLRWPHKVYHNGTITKMTMAGFEKIAL